MNAQAKLQTIIRGALAIFFLGLLFVGVASSCVPSPFAPPPICERFWKGDAVGLVEVVKIKDHFHNRRVTLHVLEIYRGQLPSEIIVKDQQTDCGVNFGSKGRYLAWFSQTKRGEWQAYGDHAEKVVEDVRYAQSMKTPPATGRIYGTLDKPRSSLFAPVDILPNRTGVTIVAENESGRTTAAVRSDLNFELPALPPGKYKIRVKGLSTDLSVIEQDIEVHAGGCNELNLFSASSDHVH